MLIKVYNNQKTFTGFGIYKFDCIQIKYISKKTMKKVKIIKATEGFELMSKNVTLQRSAIG